MSQNEPQAHQSPEKTIRFITSNANKLREVGSILASTDDVKLRSESLDLPEIQGSVEEVARDKCRRAAEMVRYILFFFVFAF